MTVEEMIAAATAKVMKAQTQTTASCPTMMYKCPLCNDTGWIPCEIAPGYTGVSECSCVKAKKAEMLIRHSGLADALNTQTLGSFVTNNDIQAKMKEKAVEYIDSLVSTHNDDKKPWFYIGGNPGSGKTHICTAICGELLNRHIDVVYMQWLSASRQLKARVNDVDFDSLVEKYTDCTVLYVDDLYKQAFRNNLEVSEADLKIAFTILNDRYLQNRATIISSEWSLVKHLLPADEAVFSRVYERCKKFTLYVPRNPANNYRIKNSKTSEDVI